MKALLLLGLLIVLGCGGDPTAPECEPAIIVLTDSLPAVAPGVGCIEIVHWYDEVAP